MHIRTVRTQYNDTVGSPKYVSTVKPVLAVTSIKQQPVLSSQTECSQMLNLYWYLPLLSSHLP